MDKSMKKALLLEALTKKLNDLKGDLGRMEIFVYDPSAIQRVELKMAEIEKCLADIDQVNREWKEGTL